MKMPFPNQNKLQALKKKNCTCEVLIDSLERMREWLIRTHENTQEKDQTLICAKVKKEQSQNHQVRNFGFLLPLCSDLYILCSKPGGTQTILHEWHHSDNLMSPCTVLLLGNIKFSSEYLKYPFSWNH